MNYEISNILYATDLGRHGPEVFRHAIGLARTFRAKIHVVNVMEPLSDYAESLLSSFMSEEMRTKVADEGFEAARKEMERRAEKLCKDSGLTRAEFEEMIGEVQVVESVPDQAILKAARQVSAELIIMGSRSHNAFGEMLLGSVAHKVVMKSEVPVFLVPIQSD